MPGGKRKEKDMEETISVEIGKRLENVKGNPKRVLIKLGDQVIGSVLLFGDNPSENIRLNEAGKFWLHDLLTK
jgi:hypothetical protein